MASSLDALVESPDVASKLGERGRARAEKYFTAANIVPQYEAVYRQVIG
jgi:glycosyltransferase involved in cell wall biosynthesis